MNDYFEVVVGEGFKVVQSLIVYNRWGNKIYEGSGANARWDGTIDGKPAPADAYLWILVAECQGERGQPEKGSVTVLR